MCILPWLSGRGGRLVQIYVSWMKVYPSLTVEDDELQIKRFLPLNVVKITLPVQLMVSAWCRFECLNCWLVIG
jgi:hypothetical protein